MAMTVGSLFSGVGGFDLGFERAGFDVRWQCEIDAACQDVLRRNFPEVGVIYDDVRSIDCGKLEPVDLICGGFPCQDVSVAGRRAGLDGERSGLWHEYRRILRDVRPSWCVIENVPGLLSSCGCPTCGAVRRLLRVHAYLRRKRKIHQPCALCRAGQRMLASHRGRDFAVVLQGLVELGYGVAWRVLDAQYHGVPQRRRRVFIVGHLGDGRAAEVLFEAEGVPGNPPPRRAAGQRVAASLTRGSGVGSNDPGRRREDDVNLVPFGYRRSDEYAAGDAGSTLAARDSRGPQDLITFQTDPQGGRATDTACTLDTRAKDGSMRNQAGMSVLAHQNTGHGWWNEGDTAQTLRTPAGGGPLEANVVTHALTGEGFDASEDGTGRGTPLVAVAFTERTRKDGRNVEAQEELAYALTNPGAGGRTQENRIAIPFDMAQVTSVANRQRIEAGRPAPTLHEGGGAHIAFGISNDPTAKYAEEVMPGLQAKAAGGGRMDAVAFRQRTRPDGRNVEMAGDTNGQMIAAPMAVRRLMPVECERLMGWPEVTKNVIIEVWNGTSCENPKSDVPAEIPSPRSPKSASIAEGGRLPSPVRCADETSKPDRASPAKSVALTVEINLETRLLRLVTPNGESRSLASSAESSAPSDHRELTDSFVRLGALISTTLGKTTPSGGADSPPSSAPSGQAPNGSAFVRLSGHEIAALASDAERYITRATNPSKPTTSAATPSSPNSGLILPTLCSYVVRAMSGYIPETIQTTSSYALNLRLVSGWTRYGASGKEMSDSTRYRMCGNGVVAPVSEWIARRIAEVMA